MSNGEKLYEAWRSALREIGAARELMYMGDFAHEDEAFRAALERAGAKLYSEAFEDGQSSMDGTHDP